MDAITEVAVPSYKVFDPKGVSVLVDTGTADSLRIRLFESWLTLWCQRNCLGVWSVDQNLDLTKNYQLVLKFSDPREAIHFKLASGALHVQERQALTYFIH